MEDFEDIMTLQELLDGSTDRLDCPGYADRIWPFIERRFPAVYTESGRDPYLPRCLINMRISDDGTGWFQKMFSCSVPEKIGRTAYVRNIALILRNKDLRINDMEHEEYIRGICWT